MEGTSSTQEMPQPFFDNIRPEIESFFTELTPDQVALLMSGSPDKSTKILLAKMLLDIITTMSTTFKMALMTETVVSEETVQSMMGDGLVQMFADVLHFKDQIRSADSERFKDLISKEVTENVNSDLSDASNTPGHITSPSRLNMIIGQTCRMLKSFAAKMKRMRSFKQQTNLECLKSVEGHSVDDIEKGSPEDSFLTARSEVKSVESTLSKELNEIVGPLLQNVPQPQAAAALSKTSQEMKAITEDLTQETHKNEQPFQAVLAKIKTFYTKCFAKALIHCKVAELKAKFQKKAKVESKKSVQLLADTIDSLVNTLQAESQHEFHVYQRFQSMSRGEEPAFTQALYDLIYHHVTEGLEFQTEVEARATLVPCHEDVDADIKNKVKNFLVLMSWWMDTQVSRCCERVTLTLKCTEVPKPESSEPSLENVPVETRAQLELQKQNKVFVNTFVEVLVWQLFDKAKMISDKRSAIIQQLSDMVWAGLEGADQQVFDPRRLQSRRKTISKILCEEFGSAENLLLLLSLNDRSVQDVTVSIIKCHLTATTNH